MDRSAGGPVQARVRIVNLRGLHARAAAKFVKLADTFDARVEVTKDDLTVTGTSILGLMMLAAAKGTKVKFIVTGEDAPQMLVELEALFAKKFDEA